MCIVSHISAEVKIVVVAAAVVVLYGGHALLIKLFCFCVITSVWLL